MTDASSIEPPLTRDVKDKLKAQGREWRQRSTYLAKRIVRDPAVLGGAAHVRGKNVKVEEVHAVWAERGVRLNDLRKRFKKLNDDDLEAALFHAHDPSVTARKWLASCIAEWAGPPRRKLHLFNGSSDPGSPLWRLDVTEFDDDGEELPLGDAIEPTFAQIIRYPEHYAPRDIVWRDEYTEGVVSIYSMKDT